MLVWVWRKQFCTHCRWASEVLSWAEQEPGSAPQQHTARVTCHILRIDHGFMILSTPGLLEEYPTVFCTASRTT